MCENSISNSVPEGRLKIGRDAILDNLQPSLRDLIMFIDVPRTSVVGYFQTSLRDCFENPGSHAGSFVPKDRRSPA